MNIWTGGTFDLVHPGHAHLFRECGRLARVQGVGQLGHVTVAVNTDEFVARFKGPPVQSVADRMTMVAAMRWVNEVQINPGGDDQAELILLAHADVIVIGDDWKGRDYLSQLCITQRWLDDHGIAVRYVKRLPELSSTQLKALIRAT